MKKPRQEGITDQEIQATKKEAIKRQKRLKLADLGTGLRVDVYPSGRAAFDVMYTMPGFVTQMHIKIGEWPEMSLPEARTIAGIVRELGLRGVDVQWGLHTRLVDELRRDGVDWRPALSEPPKKRKK